MTRANSQPQAERFGRSSGSDGRVPRTRWLAGLRKAADSTLVDMARRGSEAAWEEIVRRYDRLLAAVARSYRLSPADAADVAQVTWMQLYRHLASIREPERLPAWLARTARNESLHVASRRTETPVDREELAAAPASEGDPAKGVVGAEHVQAVRRAIEDIAPRSRRLLHLLIWEEKSYVDVSAELDMPIGSIGPTRKRVLGRLARHPEIAELGEPDAVPAA